MRLRARLPSVLRLALSQLCLYRILFTVLLFLRMLKGEILFRLVIG